MSPVPLRVLVAGGGVAALEAVLALRAFAGDRVSVEVLAPGDEYVERAWSVRTPFTGERVPRAPLDVMRHRGSLAAVDIAGHAVTTTDGGRLGYDRLIVAPGARRVEGVPGAITFRGPVSAGSVEGALHGAVERVLFVAPPGCGWPLPVYELALLAARTVGADVDVAVASYEPRPLDVFGTTASDAVARLLDRAGVEFVPGVEPVAAVEQALLCADGRVLPADAFVALPVVRGVGVAGLPSDDHGFLPVDRHGRVPGAPNVFAVGDATTGPLKQGGLAAQQADAAAEQIAAEAGAPVTPSACRHVLRAVLLTGEAPLFVRRDLDDDTTLVHRLHDVPRGKVAGRFLSPYLARA